MPFLPTRHCPRGHPPYHGDRCPACAKAGEARRPNARQRGYDTAWEKAAQEFLSRPENWFCACGCGRLADVVDHRVAHKGDKKLFWDRSNWQPMRKGCNSRKAVTSEGGFGRDIDRSRPEGAV